MALSEGQIVTYAVDEMIETVTNATPMAKRVKHTTPPGAAMQRSNNTGWYPLQQEAPTQKGWDLTGQQTGLLNLHVKYALEEPNNDYFEIRADDLRDEDTFRERIRASALKLANDVEVDIATTARDFSTLVVTSPDNLRADAAAWDMVATAEELLFSRELNRTAGTAFFMNGKDYRDGGYGLVKKDMGAKITDDAYTKGTIQRQVAGFAEVLRSPKLPTTIASTATGITVSGNQAFKPVAWILDPTTGARENVDNRTAVVNLSSTTGLKRGDKISFAGVKFLAQMTKDVLTHDATFSVLAVSGNQVTITPKPVALNDASLLPEERAYSNVNISLTNNMAVSVLNVATAGSNIFWTDDSIALMSQPIPANHKLFSGMRTETFNIPDVGINGIVGFQGDLATFTGQCRIALWCKANALRPEAIGLGLANQS